MSEVLNNFDHQPIACHSWNADRSCLALSFMNDPNVYIYQVSGNQWNKVATLSQHEQQVTGIDWAPKTDRIVTCASDRNAYVWTRSSQNQWTATMVILRINRAATTTKWSPQENKFAVGSGARSICVCYFDAENNWWVSKHIKKPIRSTVLSLDWHPNNYLLAAGSSDFKARVFSAYIKDIEGKPSPTSWGTKMPFGNMMAEFTSGGGGWVHDVSFSHSGNKLAWVGHDSKIAVGDANNSMSVSVLCTEFLPLLSCTWVSESSIVAAGHDCLPLMFAHTDGQLTFVSKLDIQIKQTSTKFSAMAEFRARDSRNQSADNNLTVLESVHQNTVRQVCIYSGDKSACTKLTSSGMDGRLVAWDLRSLESSIAGLRIY